MVTTRSLSDLIQLSELIVIPTMGKQSSLQEMAWVLVRIFITSMVSSTIIKGSML